MSLVISPTLHRVNDALAEYFEMLKPQDSKGT